MRTLANLVMGVAMALAGCVTALAAPPDGFVDLEAYIPGIVVEARYAGNHNFVGQPIDGYEAPKVFLSVEAANALKTAQHRLAAQGMTLKVFDGYRPQRAVDHFMRWVSDANDTKNKAAYYPDVAKHRLVREGYIAEKSGHSRGSTLDLTIAHIMPDGSVQELDMGSPWDFFGPISHPSSKAVSDDARANRMLLRMSMLAAGFKPYEAEWWHFTLTREPYPNTYFDFPVE
ncbi:MULTISPECIES: M15 family metallopeptidase [Kordiimonas]|jgi:D-alanyl-D-alanine dipeptidase|uniref:D-alanyl-D-alanine dipeptidase n=1 Tax=Kordiimonas lacus TaxID=637679 RepID=A0A1G6VUR9_9PROT|nr:MULTISPECIES: M15 family metallopeptidase [Kordiimonas]SDD56727.1 D-alanyl-D-alanine dipeptidase [Kordiimonas lacus]